MHIPHTHAQNALDARENRMSDDELDARLARIQGIATDQQRMGGLPRSTALFMLIFSVTGMAASLQLVMSEKEKLLNPHSQLSCDLNSVMSCGKWVGTWYNEVFFGVSNSVIGLAFFSGVTALACVLITGGRLSRILWQALCIAFSAGIAWVLWFQYVSFFVEGSICPYCYIIWMVTIGLAISVWARALQAGHWGARAEPFGQILVRNRFAIVTVSYIMLAVFTLIWFWNTWIAMLGLS